jgi:phenylacetate-CoA ligase
MIANVFQKAFGNAVVLKNLRGQRRIPYLPGEDLARIRDGRIQKIIRYAAKTVPYYQEVFRTRGINPDDIRTADDLDRLPVITKEMVRQDPSRFVSASRRGRSSVPFLTSGSTGTPIRIHHDRISLLANIAFGEREREVVTAFCRKAFGYTVAAVLYPESTTEKVQNLYRQWTLIPVRPGQSTFSMLQPFKEIVEGMKRFRPDLLLGYGSWLETFFRLLALRKVSLPLPKAVLYVAEGMTREGISLIEGHFGIPVISQYNAMESFKIGFTCEKRNGFHIHDDLCHVKVVRGDGTGAAAGEKGEIVISNLVNQGSVLLNYRLGDIGSLSGTGCGCGRTLPALSEIEGRAEDILFLPDGRFIHPRAVWAVVRKSTGVLKYQLIQHEPERFELRLVAANPDARGEILAGLKTLLGETAAIESACYEELTPQGREKFRPVLSLCGPGAWK